MQYKKLTDEQRKIKAWRTERNHLICKFMDDGCTNEEAIRKANKEMASRRRLATDKPSSGLLPSTAIKSLQDNAGLCYFVFTLDVLKQIEEVTRSIITAFKKCPDSDEAKYLQLVQHTIRHDLGKQNQKAIKKGFQKLYKKYGWMKP